VVGSFQNYLKNRDIFFLKLFPTIRYGLLLCVPTALCLSHSVADVLASIMALLFVLESLIKKDFYWLKENAVRILLLLWGYLVVRNFFTIDPLSSLKTSVPWGRYIFFALSIWDTLKKNQKAKEYLVYALTFSVSVLAIDCFFQFYTRYDFIFKLPAIGYRITGPFPTPKAGSTLLWLSAPLIAFYSRLYSNPIVSFLFSILLCSFLLTSVFITGDRMSLLGTGFFIFLFNIFFFHRYRFFRLFCVALLFMLFVGVIMFNNSTFSFKSVFVKVANFFQTSSTSTLKKPFKKIDALIEQNVSKSNINNANYVTVEKKEVPESVNTHGIADNTSKQLPTKKKQYKKLKRIQEKTFFKPFSFHSIEKKIKSSIQKSPLLTRQIYTLVDTVKGFRKSYYGLLIKEGAIISRHHFIFGVGLSHFEVFQGKYGVWKEKQKFSHTHNIYTDFLALTGCLGFGLFISFLYMMTRRVWVARYMLKKIPLYFGVTFILFVRLWPFSSTPTLFVTWASLSFWFMVGWLMFYVFDEPSS
jgi:hypothetical protein